MRQKIAVAAMIYGILFSLYGNCRDCRDKIQALPSSLSKVNGRYGRCHC
jgi:hypothetical protein